MTAMESVAQMSNQPADFQRVLLKVSGECLMGDAQFGIDPETVTRIAKDIAEVVNMEIQVCLVVGGGNIFRGVMGASKGIDKATADYMGMLPTVMNALALQSSLESEGITTRVMSAIPMPTICEPYVRLRAIRHMEKGRVVIFAAGTGSPFFTTDTAAALRATEMNCDIILKGTKVDGVYSTDPIKDPTAIRFESLSYDDVLRKELKVMDAPAVALARDNNMPIGVFSIRETGNFAKVVSGNGLCTIVKN